MYQGKKRTNLTSMVTHFKTKRLDELNAQIQVLKEKNTSVVMYAITGVAGCGKSELAKAYAWQFCTVANSFVWRLDPDPDITNNIASPVSYQQAYAELLDNFNLEALKPYDSETPEMFHKRRSGLLWIKITQYDSWILIFDNAGSYIDTADYLPPDSIVRGLVLITTQQSHFLKDNKEANFSLNQGLDPTEAIQLLKELSHRFSEDEANSRNLVQELDYSPLGIRIAGGYIHNTDTTFERYTRVLRRGTQEKLVQKMGGVEFINQVTQDKKRTTTLEMALQLSIEKVQASDPLLTKVLQYCGYLANEKIPLDLLTGLCQIPGEDKLDVEDELITVMVGKENFSLLTYDATGRSCHLHRTSQSVLRSMVLNPIQTIQKMTSIIFKLYPYDPYCAEQLRTHKTLEPHLMALLNGINSNPTVSARLITQSLKLKLLIGKTRYEFRKFFEALECLQEASQLLDAIPASEKPDIAIDIHRYLGNTRSHMWNLNKTGPRVGSEIFTRDLGSAEVDLDKAEKMGNKIYNSTDWRLGQIYNDKAEILEQDLDTMIITAQADLTKKISEFARISEPDCAVILNEAKKVVKSQNNIQQGVDEFRKNVGPAFPDPIKTSFYNYFKAIERSHEVRQLFEESEQICSGIVILPVWQRLYRLVIRQQEISARTLCKSSMLELARSYRGIALCFRREGNTPKVTEYFNRARQIYEQVLPNSYMTKIWQDPEMLKIFTDGVCPFEIVLKQTIICGKGPGLTTINATHPTRMRFSTPDKVFIFV